MRRRLRQQRRELGGIGGDLVGGRQIIVGIRAVEDQQGEPAGGEPVRVCPIKAISASRVRIEQTEPAPSAATAQLMIAADHDPGRGRQERRRWIE